jgi:protein-S-isoprenylcysteine O-methyltransferase Ste14
MKWIDWLYYSPGLVLCGLRVAWGTGLPRMCGLLGAVIITVGIWMKARLEEKFLREGLGAGAYDCWRQHVPMLIPSGPKST